MDLSRITNAELSSALEKLTGHERETTLKILYHLIELERRRLFEDEGYSSLFDYCVRKLRYSEAGACRRIAAARALQEHPEIAQLLLEGKVNLCTVATASRGLKTSVKVEEIAGKSLREVQRVTALSDPRGARPRERIRPVAVKAEELPLFKAERAREVEERYEIRFSVSKDEYERFQAVRRKLSNTLGRELTVERVFTKLIARELKAVRTREVVKPRAKHSRVIPAAVKREVTVRDGGQCTLRAPDGTRCTENHFLQFDHIIPFSCGGMSDASNVRLLCSVHNRLLAKRYFGSSKIQGYSQR